MLVEVSPIFFFNASNPTMKNGGFMAESKKEIYDIIPQKYYPKTELIKENNDFEKVTAILLATQIQFPFIAKPDIGLRGSAVKKIHSFDELKSYHNKAKYFGLPIFFAPDFCPLLRNVGQPCPALSDVLTLQRRFSRFP